jgi:hypothetical protein
MEILRVDALYGLELLKTARLPRYATRQQPSIATAENPT